MKKAFGLLIPIALVAALFYPSHALSIALGDMAPDFSIRSLEGRTISYFTDLKGKKPVYLVFWATW
jgi:hypothetical protein